jgi:hypothetical protein
MQDSNLDDLKNLCENGDICINVVEVNAKAQTVNIIESVG